MLYKVPLGPFGALPDQAAVETVPLTGAYVHEPGFNANGIARTPDGKALLIVQSATGLMFRVDPATGVHDHSGPRRLRVTNGDGLLVVGRTLYAVQNQLNKVAVFELTGGHRRDPGEDDHRPPVRRTDHGRRIRHPALPAQRPFQHAADTGHRLHRQRRPPLTPGVDVSLIHHG